MRTRTLDYLLSNASQWIDYLVFALAGGIVLFVLINHARDLPTDEITGEEYKSLLLDEKELKDEEFSALVDKAFEDDCITPRELQRIKQSWHKIQLKRYSLLPKMGE